MNDYLPHWGDLAQPFFSDQKRFDCFNSAFHLAGHHWEAWRAGLRPVASGLGALEHWGGYLDERTAPASLATALLVQGLAVDDHIRAMSGPREGRWFPDRDAVRGHAHSARRDRGKCRCFARPHRVGEVLDTDWWIESTLEDLVCDWPRICALADALGAGRILEGDQVLALLTRAHY